jgi:hypothetical protein
MCHALSIFFSIFHWHMIRQNMMASFLLLTFLSVRSASPLQELKLINVSSTVTSHPALAATVSNSPHPPLPIASNRLTIACLTALQEQQNPTVWQACNTTSWLQSFVSQHQNSFSDPDILSDNGGFLGTFSLLAGFDMTCSFEMSCSTPPPWPPRDAADPNPVQTTIVLWSLYYLNEWYSVALL